MPAVAGTLQQVYVSGPVVVLGWVAVSYERGTLVTPVRGSSRKRESGRRGLQSALEATQEQIDGFFGQLL